MLVKPGQRPAVISLVVGHRAGRKEAMFSPVLFGGLSLGTGVALV